MLAQGHAVPSASVVNAACTFWTMLSAQSHSWPRRWQPQVILLLRAYRHQNLGDKVLERDALKDHPVSREPSPALQFVAELPKSQPNPYSPSEPVARGRTGSFTPCRSCCASCPCREKAACGPAPSPRAGAALGALGPSIRLRVAAGGHI